MSKKHPGINEWKKHIQLGRRKPGSAVPEEETTDKRKPPGWQGRAAKAKAKDGRAGPAPKPATPQGKPAPSWKTAPGKFASAKFASAKFAPAKFAPAKSGTNKSAPAHKVEVPAITPPKRAQQRPLDGEGRPYITLVQFLKTIDAVGTGGAGKHAVRAGGILVNGVEDLRPGRKLHTGDVVKVAGVDHPVTV